MSRAKIYAAMKANCERLIHDLTHPEVVPPPAPLIVPQPNRTPPGFDEGALRRPAHGPAAAATQVMRRAGGITAGSAESSYDEAAWRAAASPPKLAAEAVTASASGATVGSEPNFAESTWRQPEARPAEAALHALRQPGSRAAAALLPTLARVAAGSPSKATATPQSVSTSPASQQATPPATEVIALHAALADAARVPDAPTTPAAPAAPETQVADTVKRITHGTSLARAAAEFHAQAAALAALPRNAKAPTQIETMKATLDTLRQIGPVPAYIAYLSMSDEEGERRTRGTFEASNAPDGRRLDDLRMARQTLDAVEALTAGEYATATSLVSSGTPGCAGSSAASESMHHSSDAIFRALAGVVERERSAGV